MAGPIQVGDIIKFTELAWEVWNFGWAYENNAGENYRAFGADVACLRENLEGLENAVMRAQKLLEQHGGQHSDRLSSVKGAITEVIGDYNATLEDCHQLLVTNRRYAGTTGPMRNIDWNLNMMPQVEHLRSRIQMHNMRIQTVLKPFEIDLIRNMHADLVQRLNGIRTDINLVQWTIQSLIARTDPELAEEIEQLRRQHIYAIDIPMSLSKSLEASLNDHSETARDRMSSLQEMTDCFLVHFDKSTVQLPAQHNPTYPPVHQYVELLKCQVLMNRIKDFSEIQNPSENSQWPGYVRALQEKLSHQCMRFPSELLYPEVSSCDDALLEFWPQSGDYSVATHFDIGPAYDTLMELDLSTGSSRIAWRTMQLSRQVGSHHRFRIIERWGYYAQPTDDHKVINFNLHRASFIPTYADPVGENDKAPPLEVLIEENDIVNGFVFLDITDLFKFQQAITGYEVAANYLESHATAMFVRPTEGGNIKEMATIQLWIPSHPEERTETTSRYERHPSASAGSSSPSFISPSRSSSNFSHRSTAAVSRTSWGSANSGKLDRQSANITYGLIRSRPIKPLLILFTKDATTSQRSIVALSISEETKPNPERCDCHRQPACPITAIEQRFGRPSTIQAQRLECRSNKWDLLPLTMASASAPEWRGLVRVSLLFPTPGARYRFGGGPCSCKTVTVGQLSECIKSHQGLLGIIREYDRRQMIRWQEQRDSQRDVQEQLRLF